MKLLKLGLRTGLALALIGGAVEAGAAAAPLASGAEESSWLLESALFPAVLPDETLSIPLPVESARLDPQYGRARLPFERNDGQVDSEVKFLARGPGYHLFLTRTEAVMVLYVARSGNADFPVGKARRLENRRYGPEADDAGAGGGNTAPGSHMLRIRLAGANLSPSVRGADELRGKVNYFVGNDPTRWRTNISTFAKVRCEEVYPGIDLVYYGNDGRLEYDFIVAPGADAHQIALAFEGADEVALDDAGELVLRIGEQQLRWRKPLVYQQVGGARHEIAGAYRLDGRVTERGSRTLKFVSFEFAAYDRTQPLVIDPVLVWGTFIGGSSYNGGYLGYMALDRNGNAYVMGMTDASDFPTKNPFQGNLVGKLDAFVTKLDSTGQIVYSTYISPINSVGRIAVDSAGSAYVVGDTASSQFPIVNAVQPNFAGGSSSGDAFVVKLSPEGSALVYSTYLGGSGDDYAAGVAVDSAGNAYVTGTTTSRNFPTANALQPQFGGGVYDAFIAKLNPAGTALVYSTYLGGKGDDTVGAVAVDDQGSAYIGGRTTSADFPTKSAFQAELAGGEDGFFAKLSPTGDALLFSSYFGGSAATPPFFREFIASIALGTNGDVYLTGNTGSSDFPTVGALQGDLLGINAFVARYSPASNTLVFSTYLGGTGYQGPGYVSGESSYAIGLDGVGRVYVGGITHSADFPTTADALQTSAIYTVGPEQHGYVSVLSADGSELIYSSYLASSDGYDQVRGLALDLAGNVYVSGNTESSDFPIANPILPKRGSYAVFVAKFGPIGVGSLRALKVIRSADTLLISWPASVSGAVLETTEVLTPVATWVPVATAPAIIGDQTVVTVDIEGGMKFYRLRKP